MESARIQELENLLQAGLPHVVVRRGSTDEMAPDAYRQILLRNREAHDVKLKHLASICRPEIRQNCINDRILEIVNRELADYVRDGKIQSATIAFASGFPEGTPVEEVALNVIRRACVDGPTVAAQAFADCTTTESCRFYQFFLISGIRVPEAFHPFEGISLLPLPDAAVDLPAHLPFVDDFPRINRYITPQDFLGKTLVRVEYEVSPIFHRPAESYSLESGPDRHFTVKAKNQDPKGISLDALCNALAVAGRLRGVQAIITWTSLLDYEIFDLSLSWGIGGASYSGIVSEFRGGPPVELSVRQLNTIPTLYQGLSQSPTGLWRWLRIPIDRWMKSMLENDPVDQMIDLGIALESLYVPDADGELRFRFALNGAWHQGKTSAERKALFREFRNIYDARSDVVHTGTFRRERAKSSFNPTEFVGRAQELCWFGITSIMDAGEIPDWNDLTMGD